MKQLLFLSIIVCSISLASAQKVYFEVGKSVSLFDYKTSDGERLPNLTGDSGAKILLGTRIPLFNTEIHLVAEALYSDYAAQGSNPVLGNFYSWDFINAGANLGLDFEFLKPKVQFNVQQGFSVVIKAVASSEFLVLGTQNINNQINTLKAAPEFNAPFLFARAGVGINYYFDNAHVIFVNYMAGKSFLFGDYTNQEQLKLFSHSISLGLSVNLKPDKSNIR